MKNSLFITLLVAILFWNGWFLCFLGFRTAVLTQHSAEKSQGSFPGRVESGVSAEGPGICTWRLRCADARSAENCSDSRRAAFLRSSRNEDPPSHHGALLHLRWSEHRLRDLGPAGRDGCGRSQAALFCPGRVPPAPSEGRPGPQHVLGAGSVLAGLASHTRLSLCRREPRACVAGCVVFQWGARMCVCARV